MNIKDKIYEIRGIKVMIDSDLAFLLNYETFNLNKAVKRNINKFEKQDYFELTNEEYNQLIFQNGMTNNGRGGRKNNPKVFSKEGIRTLSTILRKENIKEMIDKILEKFDDKNELILSNNNALISVNTGNSYQNMIYEIRGQLVMLDSDLSKLYGCSNGTKTINQAVNRNRDLFPDDFYFKLTVEEYLEVLRSQSGTLKTKRGAFSKYKVGVFTEQGVAMLATILKTKIAKEINLGIMRAFVIMRKYISKTLLSSNTIIDNHENRIQKLEETFNQLEVKKEHLFFEGQIYDAYSLLIEILSVAKEEIIIIDNYAGRELFDILRDVKCNIKVITKNTSEELIKKYNKQYNNVNVIQNDTFHDRFIIIDKKILYHSGSSFKDLGKKCFSITKLNDKEILSKLISKIN